MGVFNFIGTTSSGWLADKFDNRLLLFTYYGLRGLSLFYLPFSFIDFYTMTLFAVFYGLDWFATVVADGADAHQHLRPREGAAGLRLGFHRAPAWRRIGGRYRRPAPRELRRLHGRLHAVGTLCLCAAVAALFIGGGRGRRTAPRRRAAAA